MSKEEENNRKNEESNSSVIDEAIMDAEKIQNWIQENTKNMLKTTVSEQVKENLKNTLNEDEDDEEEYEEEEVEDEEGGEAEEGGEEEVAATGDEGEEEVTIGGEEEGSEEYASGGEEEDPFGGEGAEAEGGEEETFDMTQEPDNDVLDIFKSLKDSDQVEVVSNDEYKLVDDESGQEYHIRMGDESGDEETEVDLESEYEFENTNMDQNKEKLSEDEDLIYEIELEEGSENTNPKKDAPAETHEMGELSKATEETPTEERTGVVEDEDYMEEEEEVNEDKPRKAGHDPRDQVKGATAPEDPEKTSSPTDTKNHGGNLEGGFPEEEATSDGAGHHAEHVMEDEEDINLESLAEELGIEGDEESDRKSEKQDDTRDLGDEVEGLQTEAGEQEYEYEKSQDYRDEEGEVPGEQGTGPDEREPADENSVRAYNNGRNQSLKPDGFPKQRTGGRGEHFQQARGMSEDHEKLKKKYNSLLKEAKKLKNENQNFKSTLKKFRKQLAETAVFNSNLTYATRLFMEHSVTGEEKQQIMERFDKEANTLEESKKLFSSIDSELKNKGPINESVNQKIEGNNKGSGTSSQLNETNAYKDEKFGRMKELMSFSMKE